jgi:hypothetical protein
VGGEWKQLNAGSSVEVGLEMEFRPSPLVQVEVEPQFTVSSTASQYVATTDVNSYSPTFGSRYLFGDLERRELSLETRLDLIFSPTLSLQLFAQPLLSSGNYVAYKQLVAPETFDFDVFAEGTYEQAGSADVCVGGRTCVDPNGRRHIDFDGDGISEYAFTDRDFNVQSLIGNIVLRWEYRPGSTVFLVWQRSQEDEQGVGDFEFGRDLRSLINAPAQNAFMIKVNYWFALP